jgi:hypothetical protein
LTIKLPQLKGIIGFGIGLSYQAGFVRLHMCRFGLDRLAMWNGDDHAVLPWCDVSFPEH